MFSTGGYIGAEATYPTPIDEHQDYLVQVGGVAAGTNTSFSLAYPADIQAGDLLVTMGMTNSSTTVEAISGFALVPGATYGWGSSLFKIATGTESGNATFSLGVSRTTVTTMVRIRNAVGCEWIDGGNTTTHDFPLTAPSNAAYSFMHLCGGFASESRTLLSQDSDFTTLLSTTGTTASSSLSWIDTARLGRGGDTASMSFNSNVNVRNVVVY